MSELKDISVGLNMLYNVVVKMEPPMRRAEFEKLCVCILFKLCISIRRYSLNASSSAVMICKLTVNIKVFHQCTGT